MPLANIAEYECAICQERWTEYHGLIRSADEIQLTDLRLCGTCGGLTECHHPSREAIDPELDAFFSGNTGRILDENRELVYTAWRPELGLPSPMKLERICRPLAAAGLVQFTEASICLPAAGDERLARYGASYPCGACGQLYPPEHHCPRCGHPLSLVARGCAEAQCQPAYRHRLGLSLLPSRSCAHTTLGGVHKIPTTKFVPGRV